MGTYSNNNLLNSYRGPRRQQVDTPLGVGNNPFGERPLSARQPSNTAALLKALDELDDVSHIPEGLIVDVPIWKRMCGLRREKVISEQEVSKRGFIDQSMLKSLRGSGCYL